MQKFPQLIVATHSVEIMSEVPSDNILIVEKEKNISNFASSVSAVQSLIENIGGIHNIHLARLISAQKFIFVEGNDLDILKWLQNSLFPDSEEPFDSIPNLAIGGWGGWRQAITSTKLLINEAGQSINSYCILDSDYHTDNEINERKIESSNNNLYLHVWKMKEIENYLLIPSAIARVINSNLPKGKKRVKQIEIETEIFELEQFQFTPVHILRR